MAVNTILPGKSHLPKIVLSIAITKERRKCALQIVPSNTDFLPSPNLTLTSSKHIMLS